MTGQFTKAEHVIESMAGCGVFQIILMIILYPAVKTTLAYSIMFMAFGSYNPGWRCMDNVTDLNPSNDTTVTWTVASSDLSSGIDDTEQIDYVIGSCDGFSECTDVQFNPQTSTIVSEWNLICDRAWIIKLIISIQMSGMLVGSYLGGHVSDAIGRKKALWLGMAGTTISQLVSSFSVSWFMFLICRFFIGLTCTFIIILICIFISEYMTRKWRAVIGTIPIWNFGGTVLALSSWILKDWRNVERAGCVLSGLCLILIYWIPESLRWLEVKKRSNQFMKVSCKILRYNRRSLSGMKNPDLTEDESSEKKNDKRYTVFDLLRKGYKMLTVCIFFLHFALCLLFYSLTFGAKALHGNFYLNLIIANAIPLPFGLLSMLVMKVVSRRVHSITFFGLCAICSVTSIGILLSDNKSAKDFGSTILISVSKGALDGAWLGIFARNSELYPTVVRGLGVGLGSVSARVGGILAPFLIPNDKSVLYIFMIVMTALIVACGLVSLKLPETKGKVLKEKFDGDDQDVKV